MHTLQSCSCGEGGILNPPIHIHSKKKAEALPLGYIKYIEWTAIKIIRVLCKGHENRSQIQVLMILILSVMFEFFIKIRNKDELKLSACPFFLSSFIILFIDHTLSLKKIVTYPLHCFQYHAHHFFLRSWNPQVL